MDNGLYTPQQAVEAYGDTVYRLALAYMKNEADAKDVFGDVFLRFVEHGMDFNDNGHMKAWLIRVTVNCAKNALSSMRRHPTVGFDDEIAAYEQSGDPDVLYALSRLPEKYRISIHMYYIEGFSVAEIASALHKSESAIKSRLDRGRDLLKLVLAEEGGNT